MPSFVLSLFEDRLKVRFHTFSRDLRMTGRDGIENRSRFAGSQGYLSHEKRARWLGYIGDEKLPSYIGIIINHYKKPY